MRDTTECPGKPDPRGRDPEEGPSRLGKTGYRRFWREIELKGMRHITQDCDR